MFHFGMFSPLIMQFERTLIDLHIPLLLDWGNILTSIAFNCSVRFYLCFHLGTDHLLDKTFGDSEIYSSIEVDVNDSIYSIDKHMYIICICIGYVYIYIHMKVKMSLKWEIVRLPTPCSCLLCKLTSKQPIRLRPAMTAAKFAEVIEPWSTWIGRCPVSWL